MYNPQRYKSVDSNEAFELMIKSFCNGITVAEVSLLFLICRSLPKGSVIKLN